MAEADWKMGISLKVDTLHLHSKSVQAVSNTYPRQAQYPKLMISQVPINCFELLSYRNW